MAKKKAVTTQDENLLKKALDHFQECVDSDKDRDLRQEDIKFALGDSDNQWQWPQAIIALRQQSGKAIRPMLTINKIPQHINQVTNEQRQNRPAIKVRPVDDIGDKEVADVYQGITRHIEDSSNAQTAYQAASRHQVAGGIGYWRLLTEFADDESFDQEIRIKTILNQESVWLDPYIQTPEGSDAEYGFIVDEIRIADFERKYPGKEPGDWDAARRSHPTWITKDAVRIAEYFYKDYTKRKLVMLADGSVGWSDEVPKIAQVVKERDVDVCSVKWCKLTSFTVLEERDTVWDGIPIVRVVGEEWMVDGDRVIKGLVRNSKDPQRMVNYWGTSEAETLVIQPKAPYIVDPRQIEGYEHFWEGANAENRPYLPARRVIDELPNVDLGMPARAMPPTSSPGFVQAKMLANDDLKSTMGQYDASLGAQSNETSGRAINARKVESDTANYHYLDNLANSIRYTGKLIVNAIPKLYDARKVARILGEDGEHSFARLDSQQPTAVAEIQTNEGKIEKIYNLGVGKYDVTVTVGPSYATQRMEAQDTLTQLAQADPTLMQKAGDIIVRSFDMPYADKFADRLKKFLPPQVLEGEDEDDPTSKLNEMQGLLQQMEQGLQQAHALYDETQKQAQQLHQENQTLKLQLQGKQMDYQAKMEATASQERQAHEANAIQLIIQEMQLNAQAAQQQQQQMLEAILTRLDMDKEVHVAEVNANASVEASRNQTTAAMYASDNDRAAAETSAKKQKPKK